MVNSSLRNTLARRNHKERAQPLHRQRLGLLEKHKDYVHRARDYKSKQDRIRKLREKAAFRNKDEFYWGMVKGKTRGGVALGDRGNAALSTDLVKVLKTQDVGYVKVQIAKDEKKIAKLRAALEVTAPAAGPSSEWSAASELAEVEKMAEMGIVLRSRETESARRKGKGKSRAPVPTAHHVLFVDDQAELSSYGASNTVTSASQQDEEREAQIDLGWEDAPAPSKLQSHRRPQLQLDDTAENEMEDARAYRLELLGSLSAHLSRVRLLRQAEAKLATTKAHMGKGGGARIKRPERWVEDDTAPEDRNGEKKRFEGKVFKWKLERRK